jgi:hypothetical protein
MLLWVLSYDGVNQPEPLAITAAAAALLISGVYYIKRLKSCGGFQLQAPL